MCSILRRWRGDDENIAKAAPSQLTLRWGVKCVFECDQPTAPFLDVSCQSCVKLLASGGSRRVASASTPPERGSFRFEREDMSQKLKVEREGHVLCIGLNRPEKYNAMDVELYLALADAYGELQRDDELRCGLLYGEGQHFCAGLELDKWGPQFANGSFPE